MKKIFQIVFSGIMAAAILAGCETTKNTEKKDEEKSNLSETLRPTLTEAEKINLAEVILDRMLEGMKKEDYNLYTSNFFKGLKDQLGTKEFTAWREDFKKNLGDYKSRVSLGMLNKKLIDVFLWKAKFSGTDEDILIRIMLIEEDGVYKVMGFGFVQF